ncbi:regulatory particle non-ATPase [Microsporum canis]
MCSLYSLLPEYTDETPGGKFTGTIRVEWRIFKDGQPMDSSYPTESKISFTNGEPDQPGLKLPIHILKGLPLGSASTIRFPAAMVFAAAARDEQATLVLSVVEITSMGEIQMANQKRKALLDYITRDVGEFFVTAMLASNWNIHKDDILRIAEGNVAVLEGPSRPFWHQFSEKYSVEGPTKRTDILTSFLEICTEASPFSFPSS